MEKLEKQKPQESKAQMLLRLIDEACKKKGIKHTIRKPNSDVFTVSFKRRNET